MREQETTAKENFCGRGIFHIEIRDMEILLQENSKCRIYVSGKVVTEQLRVRESCYRTITCQGNLLQNNYVSEKFHNRENFSWRPKNTTLFTIFIDFKLKKTSKIWKLIIFINQNFCKHYKLFIHSHINIVVRNE
jgi:hypothetical protein